MDAARHDRKPGPAPGRAGFARAVATGDPLAVIRALRQPPSQQSGPFAVARAPLAQGEACAGDPEDSATPDKVMLHQVTEQGAVPLMSTSAREVALMLREAAEFAGGDALIAGLGLGVFPQLIEDRATSITVVEIEPAVARLVWEHVRGSAWSLVLGDAYEVIANTDRRFDFVYLDTWYGDTYSPSQLPLHLARKALARRVLRPGGKVVIWDEQGMRDRFVEDGPTVCDLLTPLAKAGRFEQAARALAAQQPLGREFFEWLLARGGPLQVTRDEARQAMGRVLDQQVREMEHRLSPP